MLPCPWTLVDANVFVVVVALLRSRRSPLTVLPWGHLHRKCTPQSWPSAFGLSMPVPPKLSAVVRRAPARWRPLPSRKVA